ncbi:MAG TPA: phosphoribosylformylglycinamidine synthase subunit PurQ [Gemmatimonadaceae bacterium]|nr:phosphoribosylformylglycinamidine synthase subunit PurQ [Gemmatimonadaceae bacterium]
MKFGIVTFPGSNCDYDTMRGIVDVLGEEAEYLWHKDHDLKGADVVVLPGGFSYGDYLRPGAIARFSPIMSEVVAHAKKGAPVLCICNGFQIACEAGLLPGALLRNQTLQFVSAPVTMRVENNDTLFTSAYEEGQQITMPVAHGDGRYTADANVLDKLEGEGRVVLRYVSDESNPNGAARNIAGIINDRGNVFGMMPHPERAMDDLLGSRDGIGLFRSILTGVLV